jgi:CheY-like chemotaxis protein
VTNIQPAILYVEDEPLSRKLMGMLLQGRMGLPHVVMFEDSENFLERVEALTPRPDVIFLDIHVQPYDGFEMLDMLRTLPWISDTRVVALTASVMNEEVQKLRSAGFHGCLAKPLDMTNFPETLARILSGERIWRVVS